jgi:tetratricopeptide (TPR) repeat protein
MWWWSALALAEIPLPSWREELLRAEWAEVNAAIEGSCVQPKFIGQAKTCNEAQLRAILARVEQFEKQVAEDGGLEYLVGLGSRLLGDTAAAEAHFKRATALRPDDFGAWNELGELYLVAGRWPDAQQAFTHVSALMADEPLAWIGPWRLAEVAAQQHDASRFEAEMREALHRGFSFQTIAGLPNWKGFYADPALHDSIEKLITVYGDRATLDTLR